MVKDELYEIPEEVITYFSKSNIPLLFSLRDVLDSKERLRDLLRETLKIAPNLIRSCYEEEPYWVNQVKQWPSDEQGFLTLVNLVNDAIARKRLSILSSDINETVIRPNNHPDIEGTSSDTDGLLDLKYFDFGIQYFPGLKRGNTVFEILLSIANSVNSMYWVQEQLVNLNEKTSISVRLDPLLIHPIDDYHPMFYKMLVYGKPLNWGDIDNLQEERHLRWMPDPGWQEDVEHTDLVWSPRNGEIHFICEEIPKPNMYLTRGSRYFHGIYIPNKHRFIHCDGAVRIYSKQEITEEINIHVRKKGKVGKRIKTFLVNGEITTTEWINLVCSYFVWNNDIWNYFGIGIKLKQQ